MSKLSYIIPVYNEERTLEELLGKVIEAGLPSNMQKEIVLVNDASKDASFQIMEQLKTANPAMEFKIIDNVENVGKSRTVRRGILESSGDFVVIQDADLEYDPADISKMMKKLLDENLDVVYGNRFNKRSKIIYFQNYVGNRFLSLVSNFFTYPRIKKWIPDLEVCYKLVKGDVMREIAAGLVSKSNFGFEPEVTAKLAKYKKRGARLRFGVIPISYYPRTVEEGKKMHAFKDGFKALLEIVRFNLVS